MKRPPKGQFKQNDLVEFGGVRGIVITTSAPNDLFPLQVMFAEQKLVVGFKKDGSFLSWHTAPLLSFVKRPKPPLLTRLKNLFKKKEAV